MAGYKKLSKEAKKDAARRMVEKNVEDSRKGKKGKKNVFGNKKHDGDY